MADSKIETFKNFLLKEGDSALLNAKYMDMSAEDVIEAYILAGLPQPILILQNTWLPRSISDHGWGNGYVKIVPGHKYHGKNYDDIDVMVSGGLTFSEEIKDDKTFPDGYWVGFDTAHYNDTLMKWPKEEVYKETLRLFSQIYHLS